MDTVFKALADKNRRKILTLLKEQDMSVSDLLSHFSISMASLSHHLDILKRADLVVAERKGQFIYYSLNTSVFEEVVKSIITIFNQEHE
jgi:DNA-binding transcriptional ArsR family regulator